MFDYISALYYGEAICNLPSDPLEDISGEFRQQLAQISMEMGDSFSLSLLYNLRAALNAGKLGAFRSGFQLGGRLMLSILEDD